VASCTHPEGALRPLHPQDPPDVLCTRCDERVWCPHPVRGRRGTPTGEGTYAYMGTASDRSCAFCGEIFILASGQIVRNEPAHWPNPRSAP
jgi:hypothetical protein